jgi:long-chain acyl-CoA synthetase
MNRAGAKARNRTLPPITGDASRLRTWVSVPTCDRVQKYRFARDWGLDQPKATGLEDGSSESSPDTTLKIVFRYISRWPMATFYELFRECAERWPSNVALEIQRRDRMESNTYAEARRMAESVARWLTDSGFQPGTRVAILADNHPRWITAYLGIMAAGCTAVPLDTTFHADQVAKLLGDSGSSLLFCDVRHLTVATKAIGESAIGIVRLDAAETAESSRDTQTAGLRSARAGEAPLPTRVDLDLDQIFAAGPGNFVPVRSRGDDLASLLYTSGTTADPKGVMLTHSNLMGEVRAVFGWAKLGPEDAVLGVLPLFHVLSQMANLLLPLVKGSRVVYLETLNTTELLRALADRKITAFAVVPQFFYLIHERIFKEVSRRGRRAARAFRTMMAITHFCRRFGWNPGPILFPRIHHTFGRRMRYLVTGGSRFDPQIGRDFHAMGIDVLQAYGLTETSAAAFATSPNNNVIGSVGKPLEGVEGKIVDPKPREEDGQPVGEIAIRGAIVMKGYWNRPDATTAVLRDRWLYTGDLGYFDKAGNLFITGREKEVIVLSNGKNIYPEEVETHYLKSPFIGEIAVVGLESRLAEPGSDRLHAVVVPNLEVLKERKIVNAKEVLRYDIESLSAQLPSTKRIGSYEIWQEALPRTTTRKLKRFEIEKRVWATQAEGCSGQAEVGRDQPLTTEDTAWLEQPDVQRALKIMREASRKKPNAIRPGDNLELDLGLDSMQRVELLVALEQELGGNLEESRLSEIYAVRELVDAVRESVATRKAGPTGKQFAGWTAVLQEKPSDPELRALRQRRHSSEAFWYVVSRLIQLIALDRFRLRVTGLDKLPIHGPFIICSNHQSFLDPIVLGSVLPWQVFRAGFAVGTSEIFGSGLLRTLAPWLRVVVVDPDANLIPAMRAGAFGLRHGGVLILYPEGERSIDGEPKRFKKGAAILSVHLQAPIVPVAIEGFYKAWPRGKRFQEFAPLQMTFGDAIYPPPPGKASEAAYEELTGELKRRVVKLWQQLRTPAP